MSERLQRARHMLTRALENLQRYERGTYGNRDAIHKELPNAIEEMIEAAIEKHFSDVQS